MNKREWFDHIAELGCVCCALEQWGECEPHVMAEQMLLNPTPGQIHHLKAIPNGPGMGQRSDWCFTICLCDGHHEGHWPAGFRLPSICQGSPGYTRPDFERRYGTEVQLWEYTQKIVAWKIKLQERGLCYNLNL
jgi:hypothetical protein